MKKPNKLIVVLISAVIVLSVCVGVSAVYLCDYYEADAKAIAAFMPQNSSWEEQPDSTIVLKPENAVTGLIFYPGGKVEHTAYIPLMQALCEKGVLCIIVKMPFKLAVLDINAADGIQKEYPDISSWYIGGHSLGGSMAAAYIADNTEDFDGLILLGSYSATDISDSDIDVLSVYGSEDTVMDRTEYEQSKENLPDDFTEVVIEGGCHAYFGMYGAQDGDGTPGIENERQIRLTADEIVGFIQ